MSLNSAMAENHEEFLAELFGGRKTKGSGSQWRDPMDGRGNRMIEGYSFAWDGKSTQGQSVAVSRDMWQKAREQAGGERPMVGLRFYLNERLAVHRDLVVLDAFDFAEVLAAANKYAALKEQGCLENNHHMIGSSTCDVCGADAYNIHGDA